MQRIVLGIETSCDDTGIALLQYVEEQQSFKILSDQLASQTDVHKLYGGVVPELAAREHLRALPVLFGQALDQSGIKRSEINAIAVTRGPGLKGCLLMGLGFAKGLALTLKCPLVGVHHIEGHLLAPFLTHSDLHFPYLALVVSGGHTELIEVRAVGDYNLIARTSDDAAGEAFDKSAALLGIEYPGGPKLAALADSCAESSFELPKVMRQAEGFSFSGLKTAISLLVKKHESRLSSEPDLVAELAHAIQESIVDALMFKLRKAIKNTGIRKVVVTGGVSANKNLRDCVANLKGVDVYFPDFRYCMDNAAMIAYVGSLRFKFGERAGLDLEAKSRWPVELLLPPFASEGSGHE